MASYALILASPTYLAECIRERIAALEQDYNSVAGKGHSVNLAGRIAEARYWLGFLEKAMTWEAPDAR